MAGFLRRSFGASAWRIPRGDAARQAAWLALPFGAQQGLRLATNVVLARLLAPEMFGVMVLINTLRTGVELLSDIGIGQSIVRSPHLHDRRFLDTAWTVQFARGVVLTIATLIAAEPLARAYDRPEIAPVIALVSATFLITGAQSANIFIMQRDLRVKQRAAYDLVNALGTAAIFIGLAWWRADLWALVWGLVLSFLLATLLTYAFPPYRLPRFTWRPEFVREIFHFGKWVFLSTAVYFAAMSTDRLYFSAVLPLALLGIYGVARTFAELAVALAHRLGSFLVFPKVTALRQAGADMGGFRRNRRLALVAIAGALAIGLAVSDRLVLLLYDARYHQAAFMLPVLLAGVWFSVLAAFGEATAFGLDRPRTAAAGNAAKFAVLIVGLPLVVPTLGVFAGLLVLALGEVARWLVLAVALRRDRLAPVGDDLVLTLLIAAAAVALKAGLGALGLAPTLGQWWALGAGVHG